LSRSQHIISLPAIAKVIGLPQKSPAVARITDRTGCQWPSRSSKVDDFHLIWKRR